MASETEPEFPGTQDYHQAGSLLYRELKKLTYLCAGWKEASLGAICDQKGTLLSDHPIPLVSSEVSHTTPSIVPVSSQTVTVFDNGFLLVSYTRHLHPDALAGPQYPSITAFRATRELRAGNFGERNDGHNALFNIIHWMVGLLSECVIDDVEGIGGSKLSVDHMG